MSPLPTMQPKLQRCNDTVLLHSKAHSRVDRLKAGEAYISGMLQLAVHCPGELAAHEVIRGLRRQQAHHMAQDSQTKRQY